MSVHLSEDEQLERLKRWWADNGKSTVVAIVVFLALWFGYEHYKNSRQQAAEAASAQYAQLEALVTGAQGKSLSSEEEATAASLIAGLKKDAKGTHYAHAAGLFAAKIAAEKQLFADAERELSAILADKPENGVAQIATLRLARVLIASNQLDKALALVNAQPEAAFKADYLEVRGDVLKRQGQAEAAYQAYSEAIAALGPQHQQRAPVLQAKADDVKPAQTVGTAE